MLLPIIHLFIRLSKNSQTILKWYFPNPFALEENKRQSRMIEYIQKWSIAAERPYNGLQTAERPYSG